MIRIIKVTLFVGALFLISACSSDTLDNTSGGIVGPDDPPGTFESVSFATQIQPIFMASCSGSGCHVGSVRSGVSLGSHSAIVNSLGVQYGNLVVLSGNAAASPIIDKLSPAPQFGVRMPKDKSALPISQVQLIAQWIEEGAQDN